MKRIITFCIGFIFCAPNLIMAATEENYGTGPEGWVRWYDMPAHGSTVKNGQDLGDVQARSEYKLVGGASCGRNAYVRVTGACYLTNSDSATDDSDSGGCGDAQTNRVNVIMRPSNYYATAADIPNNCWVEGEWKANSGGQKHSRTYYVQQLFIWINNPGSTSYAIGNGKQIADAKVTTADDTVANRKDIATVADTTMKFSTTTPTICLVTEWGEITGIAAGSCIVKAKSDGTANLASLEQTITLTYYWADIDNDSFHDGIDNCPTVYNPEQEDTDGNGIGDACNSDRDPDGDDYEFGYDNCPLLSNPDQADTDGSGIGDACNDHLDKDGDEWENTLDNCPNNFNPDQADSNNNGIGDVCDIDLDNDGVLDGVDNCPGVHNPDQADSNGDGIGNACAADSDGDGVDDQLDNCKFVYNPNQLDSNNDGIGDVCSLDSDGDGVPDDNGAKKDNCPLIPNPDQADEDKNGIGDVCEMTFVKPVASGTGDCLSWANACSDIQQALNVAAATGRSQVFLAQGTYSHNVATPINLKPGVRIVGGFQGLATEQQPTQAKPYQYLTVISGGANTTGGLLRADNLGTAEASKAIISGITLTSVNQQLDGSAVYVKTSNVELLNVTVNQHQSRNGAVYADDSVLTVRSSLFENNGSVNGGAAINLQGATTKASIYQTTFHNNAATSVDAAVSRGGALVVNNADLTLDGNIFTSNSALNGGAMVIRGGSAKLSLSSGKFTDNGDNATRETDLGGAILVENAQTLYLDKVEFSNNTARVGGALYLANGSGSSVQAIIERSLFTGNKARNHGGALATQYGGNLTFINNTLAYNKAGFDRNGDFVSYANASGGALYAGSGSIPVTLYFNTLVGNDSRVDGGAIAINHDAGTQIKLLGNLIAGNAGVSGTGGNILVANAGGSTTRIKDDGYNLVGYNSDARVSPAGIINGTGSVVPDNVNLEEIVETSLTRSGGDGYKAPLPLLPIVGGGPARNAVPPTACAGVPRDARGELRPDEKAAMCDIGAYEYTVLSCAEDAERRYQQGEIFVKSCADGLEKFELKLGYIGGFMLLLLALLGGGRLYLRQTRVRN